MNKITYIVLSLVLFLSFHVNAGNNIMYDKANQLYHNKNYDSAGKLYQQMINDGYCSSDLYYNAGNAYYRSNKIGMAVWCYEKALQINHNKNYTDNLDLVKKRIREPIETVKDIFFIRWWNGLYQMLTVNKWAVTSLVFFLLSFLFLFLKKLKPNVSIPRIIISTLLALSGYCFFMMCIGLYNQTYHYKGIIIEPQTLIIFTGKKEPVLLSEGIKVQVVEKVAGNNNYILVKLPDGREGKMNRKALLKL